VKEYPDECRDYISEEEFFSDEECCDPEETDVKSRYYCNEGQKECIDLSKASYCDLANYYYFAGSSIDTLAKEFVNFDSFGPPLVNYDDDFEAINYCRKRAKIARTRQNINRSINMLEKRTRKAKARARAERRREAEIKFGLSSKDASNSHERGYDCHPICYEDSRKHGGFPSFADCCEASYYCDHNPYCIDALWDRDAEEFYTILDLDDYEGHYADFAYAYLQRCHFGVEEMTPVTSLIDLEVDVTGREATISLNDNVGPSVDVGVLISETMQETLTLEIASTDNVPVTIESIEGDGVITVDNDFAGVTISGNDVLEVPVTFNLVEDEAVTGTVTVTSNDSENPVQEFSITAEGQGVPRIAVSVGEEGFDVTGASASINRIWGEGVSETIFTISNDGNSDLEVSTIVIENQPAYIELQGVPTNQNVAAGESFEVKAFFNPGDVTIDETFVMKIISSGIVSEVEVELAVQSGEALWREDNASVVEGSEKRFFIDLPFVVEPLTRLAVNIDSTSTGSASDINRSPVQFTDDLTASIIVAVVDDAAEEDDETITFNVLGRDSFTLTIPANDAAVNTGRIEADSEETIVINVAGNVPSTANNEDNADSSEGQIQVLMSGSSTSGATDVKVEIVADDSNEDLADPNFVVQLDTTSVDGDNNDNTDNGDSQATTRRYRTAGVSFVIELDEGVVLTDLIEVSTTYDCTIENPEDIILVLFDTEQDQWIPANDLCEVAPPAPLINADQCVITYSICHLTQFALAIAEEEETVATPSTPTTPTAPAAAVAETSSGASAEGEDETSGWVVTGVAAVLIVGLVAGIVVVAKKRSAKRKAAHQQTLAALESGDLSDASVASAASASDSVAS